MTRLYLSIAGDKLDDLLKIAFSIVDTLHNLLICTNGAIYHVVVRMEFLPAIHKYPSADSGLNKTSTYSSSSSDSSGEDEEKTNGKYFQVEHFLFSGV